MMGERREVSPGIRDVLTLLTWVASSGWVLRQAQDDRVFPRSQVVLGNVLVGEAALHSRLKQRSCADTCVPKYNLGTRAWLASLGFGGS
jgi:hypothetical protein